MTEERTLMIEFVAQKGSEAILCQKLMYLQQNSLQEKGCISYNVFSSADDEQTYYVCETYKNEAALNYHLNQPYQVEFVSVIDELLEQPFTIWNGNKVSP